MPEVNVLAVLVATIAAFVLSATYYAVLPAQGAEASDGRPAGGQPPPPWKLAVELLRSLIVAAVVAGLARHGDVDGWTGGVVLGLALWIGFPFVLWTGAMLWERTPWKLAALHGGDWLLKLPVVAVIVSVWR